MCSSTLHFVTGANIGMICFYAVPAYIFPLLPHMTHPCVNMMCRALIWCVISKLVLCNVWSGFSLVFRTCCAQNLDGDDKGTKTREALHWEEMEYCYQLGAVLAFISADIVSLVWTEASHVFWLIGITISACVWTGIMVIVELQEQRGVRSETILPIVIV